MPITDIPLFAMLRTKLHWNQERQRLLAENVANSDTPEFRPSDLAAPKFDNPVPGVSPLTLLRTNPAHLVSAESTSAFDLQRGGQFEVVPTGNAVNLEDEMLKVAANQMDFQAASAVYGRGLGLLKTAIGK